MKKYYKNFILCGEIDYYCVLCLETFCDDAAVEKHMRWEKHRKLIKIQECLPKYKKDCIYKIKDYYYCLVCNSIHTNVDAHIKGDQHQLQKVTPEKVFKNTSLVQRAPNGMAIVNNNIVKKLQWHGINDSTCSLCNVKVIGSFNHTLSIIHMSNLTQSIIKCKDGNYFRELQSDRFCCFTCFESYEIKYLSTHWIDKHSNASRHEASTGNNHSKTKKPSGALENEGSSTGKTTNNCNKTKPDTNNNISDIMINIYAGTENKYYKIDVEKKTANCLKCNASVEVKSNAFYKHRKICYPDSLDEEIDPSFYYDHGKQRSDLAKYGKANYIHLNEGGSKGLCSLCNVVMSAHMNCAKQHVESAQHRGHLELKGLVKDNKHDIPPSKCIPFKTFAKDMYGPFSFADYNVIVINEGICVDMMSIGLIKVIQDFTGPKGKCFACDTFLSLAEMLKHCKDKKHQVKMLNCQVVPIEMGHQELIRQIYPGLYHCGFCNQVCPFWENMARHLKTLKHSVQRGKNSLLSTISAKLLLNPLRDLTDIEEYNTLREWEGYK